MVIRQLLPERFTGILHATVGMEDNSCRWLPMPYGHVQSRIDCHFSLQAGTERIPYYLSIEELHDNGQILPTGRGTNIGKITRPHLERCFYREFLPQEVRCYRLIVVRVRRDRFMSIQMSSFFEKNIHFSSGFSTTSRLILHSLAGLDPQRSGCISRAS